MELRVSLCECIRTSCVFCGCSFGGGEFGAARIDLRTDWSIHLRVRTGKLALMNLTIQSSICVINGEGPLFRLQAGLLLHTLKHTASKQAS